MLIINPVAGGRQVLGSEAFRPPELLERMAVEDKIGKKSGEGFHKWSDDSRTAEKG